jgi:FKBP-type peptidyl-prolyl cis-trans isomerase 2
MDKALAGVEIEKEQTVDISAEDGFGKKQAKLIQLIATPKFKKHGITPMPGLQVNIDNQIGVVKTVTGGRTLVDFNHPCAGKELTYTFTVKRIVTDATEKVTAVMNQLFGDQLVEKIEVKEGKATIGIKMELPKEIQEKCSEKVIELVPEIKKIEYIAPKETKA